MLRCKILGNQGPGNSGANPPLIAGGLRCEGVISEPWAPHQDPQTNVHDASSIKINHWGGPENSGVPLSPQDQYENKTYRGLGVG